MLLHDNEVLYHPHFTHIYCARKQIWREGLDRGQAKKRRCLCIVIWSLQIQGVTYADTFFLSPITVHVPQVAYHVTDKQLIQNRNMV